MINESMTVKEALDKWCPYVKRPDEGEESSGIHCCFADGCMAWVWDSAMQDYGHCKLIERGANNVRA